LEPEVTYRAYYWEAELGIRIELGTVRRVSPGEVIVEEGFDAPCGWVDYLGAGRCTGGRLVATTRMLSVCPDVSETDVVADVDAGSDADAALILRFHDADNYLAGVYSPSRKAICIHDRHDGQEGEPLGVVTVPSMGPKLRMTAEARGSWMMVSISDGETSCSTPIVPVGNTTQGRVGVGHGEEGTLQAFDNFVLRRPRELPDDREERSRELYDARGQFRGRLWDHYGNEKVLLLDAYRPPDLPTTQDYVLVLERVNGS
jgi:hypothetical protein